MRSLQEALNEAVAHLDRIPEGRRYWMIRTYGGQLFDQYIKNGHVGFGHYDIPNSLFQAIKMKNARAEEAGIATLDLSLSSDYGLMPGGAVTKRRNELLQFHNEVQVGDIVVVPDKDSDNYALGIIQGQVQPYETDFQFWFRDKKERYPNRVRQTKWLGVKSRSQFDRDNIKTLRSPQPIVNIDSIYHHIEGSLSSFFVKNDQAHLVYYIEQDKPINAYALSNYLECITYFYKEFCHDLGLEPDENLTLKIKAQSKGKAVWATFSVAALLGVGYLGLENPEVHFKSDNLGLEFGASGEGSILENISDFLDRNQERRHKHELFLDSINRLQLKTIEQLEKESLEENDSVRKEYKGYQEGDKG